MVTLNQYQTVARVVISPGMPRSVITRYIVGEDVQRHFHGDVFELGSGTAPWTTFTAMRGPLAGSRLFEDVGFEPAHSLEQGILAYAEWMRANRHLWA